MNRRRTIHRSEHRHRTDLAGRARLAIRTAGRPGDRWQMKLIKKWPVTSRSPLAEKKKERRTTTAPATPAKGPNRTAHGRRPLAGARSKHCFCLQRALRLSLAVFAGSRLDARASFNNVARWDVPSPRYQCSLLSPKFVGRKRTRSLRQQQHLSKTILSDGRNLNQKSWTALGSSEASLDKARWNTGDLAAVRESSQGGKFMMGSLPAKLRQYLS